MQALMRVGFGVVAVCGLIALANAQDHPGQDHPKGGHEHPKGGHEHPEGGHEHPQDEQGGDDMADMMAAWAKTAAPGEHHAHLKPLAGKWTSKDKFRMSPDAPWQESTSKAVTEWIMGGRFLTMKVQGGSMMPGMPAFEGFGILGYDNLAEKYVSMWVDNYGTMMMTSEGTCDATGKTITFKGTYTDPMSGQPTWMKSVYKIEGNDKYVISMYGPDSEGKEFLSMEITSTRTG